MRASDLPSTFYIGQFEVDPARNLLRNGDVSMTIEPRIMDVLCLIAEAAGEVILRQDLIEQVWELKFGGDESLTRAISILRKCFREAGGEGLFIETISKRGYRLAQSVGLEGPACDQQSTTPLADNAEVERQGDGTAEALGMQASIAESLAGSRTMARATCDVLAPDESSIKPQEVQRPSIAVLPFTLAAQAGPYAGWAEALPHDLIAELSRLHWLFVIARGSSFRFSSASANVHEVGTLLSVRYCLTGNVEHIGDKAEVIIELADTRNSGIVWSERYEVGAEQVYDVRMRIVADVLAALELRIPEHEAAKCRLKDPADLSAWGAYHLGLQYMFRFHRQDNERALELFGRAVELDPSFARAHAGLSFGHFQKAFLQFGTERNEDVSNALRCAEQALLNDSLDPFANLNMGRALWLTGQIEASVGWLDRAVELNPNYAQALYSRAFSQMIMGQNDQSRCDVDGALSRSPLDPLRYAFLACRAVLHLQRGEYPLAAEWAENAARAPGAHHLISLIAVACHHLNGDETAAARWADAARHRRSYLTQDDFLREFPFADQAFRTQFSRALQAHGF